MKGPTQKKALSEGYLALLYFLRYVIVLEKKTSKKREKESAQREKRHPWDQNGTRVGKIHQPMSNQPLSSGEESMQRNQHEKRVLLRSELHR